MRKSLWFGKKLPQFPRITKPGKFDVIVVGGGITGITAAYLLKKSGHSVALVERDRCAQVDTGHTTAHLTYVTDLQLTKLVERFGEDHARAKKLADGLRQIPGLIVDAGSPFTNMVYMNLSDDVKLNAAQIVEQMKKYGILLDAENSRRFRLVTHYWIDDERVQKTIFAFRDLLA